MILSFAIGLFAGCTRPTLPDPVVEGVEPAYAYNGDDETVTIYGRGFYPQVAIDTWQGGTDIDKSFSAWLVGGGERFAFVGVGIGDDQHLSATLEPGVPPGRYDLEVEGPTGARGRLDQAFTVTDAEAARVVLESPDGVVFVVTDEAELRIELQDLGGDRVAIPFEISLFAPPTITFVENTLRDGLPTAEGEGIRGFVDDGSATVTIYASAAGPVTIEVVPRDPKSTVLGDTLELAFQPGDDVRVALRLPVPADPKPVFVAGTPFVIEAEQVDQFGNPVAGPTRVTLKTVCSGWVESVTLDGPTAVEVMPRFATNQVQCPEDWVESVSLVGESPHYTVVAGAPHHFAVFATSPTQAGERHGVFVDPKDLYDNHTTWVGTLAMVDAWGATLDVTCSGAPSVQGCTYPVERAGTGLTLTVTGDDGLTGTSNPFDVLPGTVPESVAIEVTGPSEAGIPHPVVVRPIDAWGNTMNAAILGAEAFVIEDPLGEVSCTFDSVLPDGAASFGCALFTATVGTTLDVNLPDHDLGATSAPFDVVNGTLAVVRFAGETTVVAGSVLNLALTAEDGFGNRYVVQSDPIVGLHDDSGTFSAGSVTLEVDGTADVGGFFTRSGVTIVRSEQGDVDLGGSDPIPVVAAATSALRTTVQAPWAWEDEPQDLTVEAVDTFGNRASWNGTAVVSSSATASLSVSVGVSNGVGVDAFVWTGPAFPDVLEATGGGFVGDTEVVVVRRCAAGPTAAVAFAGFPEAIACADPDSEEATITADLSGSVPGIAPLDGFAVAEVGGPTQIDAGALLDLDLVGIGRHALQALAVDTFGCGDEVLSAGWLGPDDGTPVGPVPLVTTAVDIEASDVVTVDLPDIVDCSGDPAAFEEVRVRATGGDLAATATGAGLVVELDANGDGAFTLTTTGGLSYGDLELHASVPSGAAGGRLDLPVADDNIYPTIIAQEPVGTASGTVSEVRLWFSEPLLAGSVTVGNFGILGPSVTTVVAAELLDGAEVVLTVDPPIDAGSGGWLVTASSQLRDEAGNRLAGDWDDLPAPYVGAFGVAGAVPSGVTCATFDPTGLVIRPDGDPGVGVEADAVSIGLATAQAPAWWVLEVIDAGGVLVRQDHVVPSGPNDVVVWDGRDARGLVVGNGSWQVEIWPDDGLGNRGAGCGVTVSVDNWLGVGP